MAKHLDGIRILSGEDRKLRVLLERAREVSQIAVGARHERFLRESRGNLARDFGGCGAPAHFADGAVRQRDLNVLHAGSSILVETSRLLAQADAVKACHEWGAGKMGRNKLNPVPVSSVLARRGDNHAAKNSYTRNGGN